MKKHTFKSLIKYIKTLPVISTMRELSYLNQYALYEDENKYYLVSLQPRYPDYPLTIHIGTPLKKILKSFDSLSLKFINDTMFIPHNLDGPSYYNSKSHNIVYHINGEHFTENEFNLHPEVITHHKKLSLKKKLKALS